MPEPDQHADTVAPPDECEACMELVHEPCSDHSECDHPSRNGVDQTWGPDKVWRCMACDALLNDQGDVMRCPECGSPVWDDAGGGYGAVYVCSKCEWVGRQRDIMPDRYDPSWASRLAADARPGTGEI